MSYPEKHIALLCNPTRENEKALRIANNIEILLSGIDIPHKIFTSTWPESFNGFTEVWIIGGDGTMNWFINQYPDIRLPLALFAGGAGNDFHWMLYGNKTTEQQVDLVLQSTPQLVDAGTCNEKLFLNGVGIGFDGAIVKTLINKKKNPGKVSYLTSVFKRILFYKGIEHEVKIDAYMLRQKLLMINVANGKTEGGGFQVAPKAELQDGLLDINIVKELSSLKRLFYLSAIEKGKHLHLPLIEYHHARRIEIRTSTLLPAHLDGEYFEADHFVIECLPKRFSFLR